MYEKFGISKKMEELSKKVEMMVKPQFDKLEKIYEENSLKVLKAMQDSRLSLMHLNTSTGYGIDEIGRNKIEEIFLYLTRNYFLCAVLSENLSIKPNY